MFSQYRNVDKSAGNVSSSTSLESPSSMTSSQSSMTSSQSSKFRLGDDESSVSPASSTMFSPSPHPSSLSTSPHPSSTVFSPSPHPMSDAHSLSTSTEGESEQTMAMTDSSEASGFSLQASSGGSPEVSSTPKEVLASEGKAKARPRKRRQPKAPKPPPHEGPTLPPCRVCHMKASGFHYGANTCEGCKGFFRRALQNAPSKCIADTGNCNVIGVNRKLCACCRYQKCLSVGMGREAIKIGRYTCETRSKNIQEAKEARDTKPTQSGYPVQDPPQCIGSHDNSDGNHDNGIGNPGNQWNNVSPIGYAEAPTNTGLDNIRDIPFQPNASLQGNIFGFDCKSETQNPSMQPNDVGFDSATETDGLLYAPHHNLRQTPEVQSMVDQFSNRMFDMEKMLMSSLMSPNEDALMEDVDCLLDNNTRVQIPQNQIEINEPQQQWSPSHWHLSQNRSNMNGSQNHRVRDSIDEFLFGPNSASVHNTDKHNHMTSQTELNSESHLDSTGVTQQQELNVPFNAYKEIHQISMISQENSLFPNFAASEYKSADALQSPHGQQIEQSPIPGEQSPIPGEQSPIPGEQSPIPGEQSPIPGEQSHIPGGLNQMDIHSECSTSPSNICSPCNKPECHNIDFDEITNLQQKMLSHVKGDINIEYITDASQDSSKSPSSSDNHFEQILSLGSNISTAISEVLNSSEMLDISLDKKLCDVRTKLEKDILERFEEPEGLWTDSDKQTTLEMLKKYQAVNRVHERVARPKVEFANTAIDDMIHNIELNHDKHVRMTTYMSDIFIQARQVKFMEMVQRREMVFGKSYSLPSEEYFELYKATGHDFENRIHRMNEFMTKTEESVRKFISFVKSIPGFKTIDIKDRILMVKKSRIFVHFLGVLNGFNKSLGVFLIPDARCVEKSSLEGMWTKEVSDIVFETANRLQQETWLPEELALLKGLLLTMIDKEKLQNPSAVEKLQNTLLACLARALKKRSPDIETTELVGQSLSKLKLLQPMVIACEKRFACPRFHQLLRFKLFVGKHPLLLEMFT